MIPTFPGAGPGGCAAGCHGDPKSGTLDAVIADEDRDSGLRLADLVAAFSLALTLVWVSQPNMCCGHG